MKTLGMLTVGFGAFAIVGLSAGQATADDAVKVRTDVQTQVASDPAPPAFDLAKVMDKIKAAKAAYEAKAKAAYVAKTGVPLTDVTKAVGAVVTPLDAVTKPVGAAVAEVTKPVAVVVKPVTDAIAPVTDLVAVKGSALRAPEPPAVIVPAEEPAPPVVVVPEPAVPAPPVVVTPVPAEEPAPPVVVTPAEEPAPPVVVTPVEAVDPAPPVVVTPAVDPAPPVVVVPEPAVPGPPVVVVPEEPKKSSLAAAIGGCLHHIREAVIAHIKDTVLTRFQGIAHLASLLKG